MTLGICSHGLCHGVAYAHRMWVSVQPQTHTNTNLTGSYTCFYFDVYYNCHNLTILSLPVKKPFVSRYEWTIDCFLQVTGHWHQVWITPRGTSIKYLFKKNVHDCFSQMGDALFASLMMSELQKLEKGSILRVYNGVHLMMEVPPPLSKSLTSMLFTVNERS